MKLPPYTSFPIIAGDKISLREILSSDIKNILEISCYDAVRATTWQEANEMQMKINKDYEAGNSIHWGIADNLTNDIIGTCGYYRGLADGSGELGCILLPDYRGKGFMTDAMQLAIDFGISTMGLKRVWARTTRQNDHAIKLLTKLNFIKIADFPDGEIEYGLNS